MCWPVMKQAWSKWNFPSTCFQDHNSNLSSNLLKNYVSLMAIKTACNPLYISDELSYADQQWNKLLIQIKLFYTFDLLVSKTITVT
jgi:hypothetical protein